MSVEAVFELASDELLLGKLADACPTLAFEIERVVPTGDQVMPYVWVYGEEIGQFRTRAQAIPGVESVVALDTFEESGLYRIEWSRTTEQFVTGILDTGGVIVEARGSAEWQFHLRFTDGDDLSAFRTHCQTHDIVCRLQQVYAITETSAPERKFGLTAAQHEALVAAVDAGYFEVPREVTFDDIAAELDISQQAVSERVRRGVNKVLSQTMST